MNASKTLTFCIRNGQHLINFGGCREQESGGLGVVYVRENTEETISVYAYDVTFKTATSSRLYLKRPKFFSFYKSVFRGSFGIAGKEYIKIQCFCSLKTLFLVCLIHKTLLTLVFLYSLLLVTFS